MTSIDPNVIKRRNTIALKLLASSDNKVQIKSLEEGQQGNVDDDLPVIQEMMIAFDLITDYGLGSVRVKGLETDIRRAMRMILQDFIETNQISDIKKLLEEYPLLDSGSQKNILAIIQNILKQHDEINLVSSEFLLTELYILYLRYENGAPKTHQLSQMFTTHQLAMIQSNRSLFDLSKTVIATLGKAVKKDIPEIEIYYFMLKMWLSVQS
ncbi:hypothetical protein [Paucilactobacillus sp. N302-9]